jgi:hypothetical protein
MSSIDGWHLFSYEIRESIDYFHIDTDKSLLFKKERRRRRKTLNWQETFFFGMKKKQNKEN